MRSPYTQLYLHCVWATWDRMPLNTPVIEGEIYKSILSKSNSLKCKPLAIGGIPDHIHLLVSLHPTISVADFVKGVKGSSSHLITHEIRPGKFFKWQGSYGAFTVSKSGIGKVTAYINNQKQHHADDEIWTDFEMMMREE